MAIPLFFGDATQTDSYVNATVQISGYHITEEIYCGGRTNTVRLGRSSVEASRGSKGRREAGGEKRTDFSFPASSAYPNHIGGRTLIYPDQFAVVIKQSTETSTRNVCDGQSLRIEILKLLCAQAAISLKNARLDRARLQLLQSNKMSPRNSVVGVPHEINNSVGLNAVNLQHAAYEVFDVHS